MDVSGWLLLDRPATLFVSAVVVTVPVPVDGMGAVETGLGGVEVESPATKLKNKPPKTILTGSFSCNNRAKLMSPYSNTTNRWLLLPP